MADTHFLVTSTGKSCPWARQCITSVANQDYDPGLFQHEYWAADRGTYAIAKSVPVAKRPLVICSPAPVVCNVYSTWRYLPPMTVIVWVDGDDWLYHSRVLTRLNEIYQDDDVWMTYGSFMWSRHPGWNTDHFGSPYPRPFSPRTDVWRASHLKTFRAGLMQKIKKQDLMLPDGSFGNFCTDRIFMLPMLEMCGPEHYRAIPEILSVYNFGSSWSFNAKNQEEDIKERDRVHALPCYSRLSERPF